jgi:hypothetical protein
MMRRRQVGWTVLAAALLLLSSAGEAQQTPPPAAPAETPKPPAVAPEAISALAKMGAFLRTLKTFAVRADTTTDEVLDTGQKIQLDSTLELRVRRRPDRLRADVRSARIERQFFYDGKTLTLYGARLKYYATTEAPPTIQELLDLAEQRYGLTIPLEDLFYWGSDTARSGDIQGAFVVGPSRIGGVECDQYAFREEAVDWQIWIERGKTPLPRKLVITTRQEEGQPQYVAVLRWDLAPRLDDKTFTFTPPKDARRIVFRTTAGQPAGQKP